MTNSSDGNSPSIRPQLGVGFNRALPAPFAFDNGIKMDGVNDRYLIPLLNKASFNFPANWSFEMWVNYNGEVFVSGAKDFFGAYTATSVRKFQVFHFSTGVISVQYNGEGVGLVATLVTGRNHIVCTFDGTKGTIYLNGVTAQAATNWNNFPPPTGLNVNSSSNPNVISCAIKHDALRFYNVAMTPAQVALNYNSGAGENPFATENLLLFFRFQEFEILDFSAFQDDTDMRLGIRDISGKYCHAAPVLMETVVGNAGYPFVPF